MHIITDSPPLSFFNDTYGCAKHAIFAFVRKESLVPLKIKLNCLSVHSEPFYVHSNELIFKSQTLAFALNAFALHKFTMTFTSVTSGFLAKQGIFLDSFTLARVTRHAGRTSALSSTIAGSAENFTGDRDFLITPAVLNDLSKSNLNVDV